MMDAISLLHAIPGCHLLLLPDAPRFTIVDATDTCLSTFSLDRQENVGKSIFEAMDDDRHNAGDRHRPMLAESLAYVLRHRTGQRMAHRRCKAIHPETGMPAMRLFNPSLNPVLNAQGGIDYLIYSLTDETDKISLQTAEAASRRKLGESEDRFRLMIERAPVGILLSRGEELIVESVNAPMLQLIHRTSVEEVIGRRLTEVMPELKEQQALETVLNVLRTGKSWNGLEVPVSLIIDGQLTERYFNLSYTPILGEAKPAVLHVAVDVTEQVLSRHDIRASEEKYRTLFNAMDQGFCMFEIIYDRNDRPVDYRFLEINPVFEEQTGLKNAIGKTALELVPNLEKHWIELYARVAETGVSTRFEEGSAAMGRWFDVFAYRPGGEESRKVALLFKDITPQVMDKQRVEELVAQRTAELASVQESLVNANRYLQVIINHFETALASLVPVMEQGRIVDFRFKTVNAAYTAYSKLSVADTQGRRVSEIFPEYFKTEAFNQYVTIFETGESQKWELHYNVDGLDVYFEVVGTKVEDELIVHLTDFTHLKRLQYELLNNIRDLKRSNQNLEQFAYAASHDMKEPIRKIHVFADLLKARLREKLGMEDLRIFERLETAATRMTTLIDDLLTYSHIGRDASHKERVDLNNVVSLVLEDLELSIAEKNAEIAVGALPVVEGHRRQLQQLFENLVGNALKYAKPDTPPVVAITSAVITRQDTGLKLTDKDRSQQYHLIEVADNGIGFSQEDAERIFNVFTRLHGNAHARGTGVGLSIVRKVAENHNGYIWARGLRNEGAVFNVLLPAD